MQKLLVKFIKDYADNYFKEAIKIKKINNIFNVKQSILICLKNNIEIPILDVRKPLNLNELEREASELASFLQIPIRT